MLGGAPAPPAVECSRGAVGKISSALNHRRMTSLLDAQATALRLPYAALVGQIREVLADPSVQVPERLVQALPGGGSLFVMPALDAHIAIAKLITFTPANAGTPRPAIQGDVVVFDAKSGERRLMLDGPTVTARRTAAVSLLAAQELVPNANGPLLVVGAGAQGRAHIEAFVEELGVKEVRVASRSEASAHALAEFASSTEVIRRWWFKAELIFPTAPREHSTADGAGCRLASHEIPERWDMSSKPQLLSPAGWRNVLVSALLGIVVVAQLAALWMVCLDQVRKAQARHENLVVEQRAVEDCVRQNAKGSLISCADRAADERSAAAAAGRRNDAAGR
jgi:hypothetical protein